MSLFLRNATINADIAPIKIDPINISENYPIASRTYA